MEKWNGIWTLEENIDKGDGIIKVFDVGILTGELKYLAKIGLKIAKNVAPWDEIHSKNWNWTSEGRRGGEQNRK